VRRAREDAPSVGVYMLGLEGDRGGVTTAATSFGGGVVGGRDVGIRREILMLANARSDLTGWYKHLAMRGQSKGGKLGNT